MTERTRRYIITAAFASVVIIGAVFMLYLYGRDRSAVEPEQAAPIKTEPSVEPWRGEKEVSAGRPKSVLQSELAGSWYPAEAAVLKKMLEGYFDAAVVSARNDVIAVILPHAGYSYSGKTACAALKTIGRGYERIIVIGPSHTTWMENVLSVPRVTHYETPLGQISLDVEFIEKLLQYAVFQNVPRAHQREHSVQIELPLLQFLGLDFKLVPIVAGSCSLETVEEAAAVLRSMVDENTLVVASSDFVHYGASYGYVPFTENIPERLKGLDMGAFKLIEAVDAVGFMEYRQKTGATICGHIPIAVLLSMLDESVKAELIDYTRSGELEGDYSRSVSYLSIVFRGSWVPGSSVKPAPGPAELTDSDREKLIELARKAISYAIEYRRIPQVSELGIEVGAELRLPRAAFVTLKKGGLLRGCIGDIFPSQPLYKSVLLNAINAALRDRRFAPLQEEELDAIRIEISVLTRPKAVPCWSEIQIGRDGIVLTKGGQSAVFLPQVAPEQGWDLSETLSRLAMKAGLSAEEWKEGAEFLVFQADVFGEGEK